MMQLGHLRAPKLIGFGTQCVHRTGPNQAIARSLPTWLAASRRDKRPTRAPGISPRSGLQAIPSRTRSSPCPLGRHARKRRPDEFPVDRVDDGGQHGRSPSFDFDRIGPVCFRITSSSEEMVSSLSTAVHRRRGVAVPAHRVHTPKVDPGASSGPPTGSHLGGLGRPARDTPAFCFFRANPVIV